MKRVRKDKNNKNTYIRFLHQKINVGGNYGFSPVYMPNFLFDFQINLVDWALRKGRAAIFADCGLGKTPMQLVWAQNIVQKTNKPVLIIAPLAVSVQTVHEGKKFGIECARATDGSIKNKIVVTNYERLHHFDSSAFSGVVCDESSILKHFGGKRRKEITEFMRKTKYRLLCTATPSPNDFVELGTSSEALGYLGYMDMLGEFFRLDEDNSLFRRGHLIWEGAKWVFKAHAQQKFWQWICTWGRACRKPSDLGFMDGEFVLPQLNLHEHIVRASRPLKKGRFFILPASTLEEQREERLTTIPERCAFAWEKVRQSPSAVLWCHYNAEADYLASHMEDVQQIKGGDSIDKKEELLLAFTNRQLRYLATKPRIGGFGLNWQHCSDMSFFPSHSFEQYYQSVRRCWRYGQKNPVNVHIISTEGEKKVLNNLKRKEQIAEKMHEQLIAEMLSAQGLVNLEEYEMKTEVPQWL